ncbi:MAG: citrate/2-methylcitrate synthase [Propionibacteriaceae bacterium]|jgi:citrate synthase|nr:citrate/2-methylcitrate synthase [Propionibacteriaceae bacterium]
MDVDFSQYAPSFARYGALAEQSAQLDPELFSKYEVKRGLRDSSGVGVLAGLTRVSEVQAMTVQGPKGIPCHGKLRYRGYDVEDLVEAFAKEERFGFEETIYLLLFGELPTSQKLEDFSQILVACRDLRSSFTRDVILKAPSRDMVIAMARCVLTLYSYDDNPDDVSIENLMRQSLQLISVFPRLAVYSYLAAQHYHNDASLHIHAPDPQRGIAENLLLMLRQDKGFTPLEARVLDLTLVLHADHGGGNNSTFSTHVVSSTGTDSYSAIATALGSLKGPRHGGANIRVAHQFADLKESVRNWDDDSQVNAYLQDVLAKKAYDHSGLIYGMGHAVYTLSDPRARVLKLYAEKLAQEKGRVEEFELRTRVERLATEALSARGKSLKPTCANVDFYSGFVYEMLDIPQELFTPLFAIARIPGWCAHRIEEIVGDNKIIRPAYKNVNPQREYQPLAQRPQERQRRFGIRKGK